MLKQITTSALVMVGLLSAASPALSQSQPTIPNGYVLVPMSALSETVPNFSAPSNSNQQVSAITPSVEKSILRASDEFEFIGGQGSLITAVLRDANNRPLAGRNVNLISSRADDHVTALSSITNTNGEATFRVTGNKEGVGTFTAIDQTSGTALAERVRIVFLTDSRNGIGGNAKSLRSNLIAQANTNDPIASDENLSATYDEKIEAIDFPTETITNTPLDIIVRVSDLDGYANEYYTGTIMFDSTDPLAILPESYTFTDIDRGEHTFYSAITLDTLGTTKILISSDTATEPAELYITVNGQNIEAEAPIIDNPADGLLTNQDTTTLSGFATPNSNLVVLIDGRATKQFSSDLDGSFTTDLTELTDGNHELEVAILQPDDTVGATSDTVNITLDTVPPDLADLQLIPGLRVELETPVVVTAFSEAGLKSAELFINEGISPLNFMEVTDGEYAGQLETTALGDYSLQIRLTDLAGNSADFPAVATLTVVPPLTINSLETAPANARVDLSWEPPDNHAEISYYIIQYGPVKDSPDQQFQTPDSRTTWYIDQLNNDTTYYFQVASYDESDVMNGYSVIASETPHSLLNLQALACDTKVVLDWRDQADEQITNYQIIYGIESGKYIETQNLPDHRTHWEVRNLLNGVPYFFTIRGLDATNQVISSADEEISATPGGNACHGAGGGVGSSGGGGTGSSSEYPIQLWQKLAKDDSPILVWNPVPSAMSYKVYAGTQPNFFDLPSVTVTTPYLKPTGLTPEQDYYFAVRAIFEDNHEAANFSNVLQLDVGPAAILALALLAAVGGSWLIRKKFAIRDDL